MTPCLVTMLPLARAAPDLRRFNLAIGATGRDHAENLASAFNGFLAGVFSAF